MYISNLKIQGFKSFLNKTELTFGEGITTVVGPNGCGKTNIVDAIRWILGEQKTSVLRSNKMEDVIFNGTKNRKPVGMCEASLTIHNNLGLLPTEYSDVEITRRLFRSGESEYLLNKTPCRLKDIHDLFIDTGMSSNAYSVIELKMIDSILSHNADDRRRMFEEAAGINQYKKQRRSTFKKLETTIQDLDRVKDIIAEIENNLRNLKLQLKRYERHKKMTKDLHSAQILLAQIEINKIQEKCIPLQESLKSGRGEQDMLAGQLNLDESLINSVQDRYELLKGELDTCNSELKMVEEKLSIVNNNILVWTEQRKGNESKIQHFSDEVIQANARLESLESQSKELTTSIEQLIPSIENRKQIYVDAKKTFDKIDKVFLSDQQKLNEEKSKSDQLNHKIYTCNTNTERARTQISEKENYINILIGEKSTSSEKSENYKADLNLLKAQLSSKEADNNKLSLKLEKAQETHAAFEAKLIELNSKASELSTLKLDAQHKLKFYQEIVERNEGRSSGVKWILENGSENGIVGVLGDIVTPKEGYENAIISAIENYASVLIVNNIKDAKSILEKVTLEKKQISIIALDSIPSVKVGKSQKTSLLSHIEYPKELNSIMNILFKDVHIISSKKSYWDLSSKERLANTWISMDGQRFEKMGIIKSKRQSSQSDAIGRMDKIKYFKGEIKKIESEESQLLKEKGNVEMDANKAFENNEILNQRVDKASQEIINLEKELSQKEYVISQQKNLAKESDSKISQAQKEITQLNIKLVDFEKEKEAFKSLMSKQQNQIEKLTKRIEENQNKRNSLQQKVQDARVQLIEVEKEHEGFDFRQKNTLDRIGELKKRIIKFENEKNHLQTEILRLANSIETSVEKKQSLMIDQEKLNVSKSKLDIDFNSTHNELQRLQSNIRDQQKAKEERIMALQQVELKLAELNQEEALVRERIRETYKEEVPPLRESVDFDEDELRAQVESIDKSLERIGAINMAAQEEFERELERFNFLKEQFDDLVDSEKTLKETIERLDKEARDRFTETYDAIKAFFKETYTMFFEGGEAYLRLVGDDDPLEASIEIIAKPPGKKPQTLRMLSAGEKALTAISLLFAIYMVKPSPFCILDEVDAPLDDRNIGKFTKVLKQFAEKTQFIVVTHNKLTMEKADYLYGVTQKEEGVSQIVSVRFAGDSLNLAEKAS